MLLLHNITVSRGYIGAADKEQRFPAGQLGHDDRGNEARKEIKLRKVRGGGERTGSRLDQATLING